MPGKESAESRTEQGPYIGTGSTDDGQDQDKAEKYQGRGI